MMPLAISNRMISDHIRNKKKKMITSEPDFIDTSPTPDLNAQDIYNIEQHGRIEGTLESEDKINADLTNIDEDQKYSGVGISPEQKKRMGRLRMYMDSLPLNRLGMHGEDNMARMNGGMMMKKKMGMY